MGEESVLLNHHQQQPQSAEVLQLRDSADSTNRLSMLAVAGGGCGHQHCNSPCATACNGSSGSNSLKRRPPAYSYGSGDRSAKKLFCDQEDLNLHGFSAVSLPVNLGRVDGKGSGDRQRCPFLRRCVSDAYKAPSLSDLVAGESPECAAAAGGRGNPVARGYGLPPRPPSLRRTVSSPAKALSRALSSEETTPDSSMKLRRMKDRMKEMKQWWDEVLEHGEEEVKEIEEEKVEEKEEKKVQVKEEGGGGGELDEFAVAEEDKFPPQDELGGYSEEAISVEWVKQCLSLTFRCPCGKGYEVLLNGNNCYYKLV